MSKKIFAPTGLGAGTGLGKYLDVCLSKIETFPKESNSPAEVWVIPSCPDYLPFPIRVGGRLLRVLEELRASGVAGLPTKNCSGSRSRAVSELRRRGIEIVSEYVGPNGEWASRHGRYVLKSQIEESPEWLTR